MVAVVEDSGIADLDSAEGTEAVVVEEQIDQDTKAVVADTGAAEQNLVSDPVAGVVSAVADTVAAVDTETWAGTLEPEACTAET